MGSQTRSRSASSSATVTVADVLGVVVFTPSFAVTRTASWSPRSPFPTAARFSVERVAPTIGEPFFSH